MRQPDTLSCATTTVAPLMHPAWRMSEGHAPRARETWRTHVRPLRHLHAALPDATS